MRHRVCVVLVWLAFATTGLAQQSMNLGLLKKDTQILEGIVLQVLRQNFTSPFAITGEPRGAYVQGYGVVVSFQLNINRGTIRTPFGEMVAPKGVGHPNREAQIVLMKDAMIQCLADYGNTIKQLAANDRISISACVEDRNELDPTKSRTVVVLTALKDDVNLLAMKKLSLDKFRQRVHVLQY